MTSTVSHLAGTAVPEGPRVSFTSWRAAVERDVMHFEFDCDRPRSFTGVIGHRALGGVDFIDMYCRDRHVAHRDRRVMTEADTGYVLMTLQLAGEIRIEQDGRTALLTPGRFAVYDSSRPATLVAGDEYRSTCVRFRRDRLGPAAADRLAGLTATALEHAPGLPTTTWDTLISVNRNLERLGRHGPSAVRSAMDLVELLLRDGCGAGPGPAPAPDPLEAVKDFVDRHLGDEDLTPSAVAAAHHISRRRLDALFERTGTGVARWIRTRRVEACRRDLADPALADVPVARIGARWGFGSPAHFGHVFKQETGLTPGEFRRGNRS